MTVSDYNPDFIIPVIIVITCHPQCPVLPFPAVAPAPLISLELTVALSVLVPCSVILVLFLSVFVPAVTLKRRKKTVEEKNQDYATVHADDRLTETGKSSSTSCM